MPMEKAPPKYWTCCQSQVDSLATPTDRLIAPLIHLSELGCRISDTFSYDDIENAVLCGEMILELTAPNFRTELDRLRTSVPAAAKDNREKLRAAIHRIEMWIHEIALHAQLWDEPNSPNIGSPLKPPRLEMLYRSLTAMETYCNLLVETPQESIYHFAIPTWAGWVYAAVIACRVVFLEVHELRHSSNYIMVHDRNPMALANETEAQRLLNLVYQKLSDLTLAADDMTGADSDHFFRIACLQKKVLDGFERRGREKMASARKPDAPSSTNDVPHPQFAAHPVYTAGEYAAREFEIRWSPADTSHATSQLEGVSTGHSLPLSDPGIFFDDTVWDMMMDDFSMPAI
ncbi:hypothetical protein BU16DRAFT_563824 [Lophium mytilinum]|uniref:Uncharacterized protein n=1 Tax=Lophium mytilinum TaxID=390894 RepID=A0A6A6QN38_9PEZI|nr:hypothetical protein BU16DRAFT_563824 [Lophium mytilinum]